MKENKSKFNVGDSVFYLENNQLQNRIVVGVVASFSEPGYSDKRERVFLGFKYYFEQKKSVESYGWIEEKNIFKNKEELIGSIFLK